jgi:hypothetical protein
MSLQEAISKTGVSYTRTSNSIVVDKKKSSKKREVSETTETDEAQDCHFWREQYFKMKSLKEDCEKDLNLALKLKAEENDAHKQYIHQIEERLKLSDSQRLTHITNIAEFYEMMTSMTVKNKEQNVYVCTLKNSEQRVSTKFSIFYDAADTSNIKYTPIANSEKLPEYLQASLEFDSKLCPVLLCDSTKAIFNL